MTAFRIQLIASLLIVGVLSGAQCLSICLFAPGSSNAAKSDPHSCHHGKPESSHPKPESCSHHEFIAAKSAVEPSLKFGAVFAAAPVFQSPLLSADLPPIDRIYRPPPLTIAKNAILRI